MPHPNDPKLRSFIPVAPTSDFPIQNLPYGIFSAKDGLAPRVGVAIGDYVLDLWQLAQDCRFDVVEPASLRRSTAQSVHGAGTKGLVEHARADQRAAAARSSGTARQRRACASARWCRWRTSSCIMPFAVAGYTDFYSSKEHATNVGVMFRGKDNALAAELAAHADRLQRPRVDRGRQRHARCGGRAGS